MYEREVKASEVGELLKSRVGEAQLAISVLFFVNLEDSFCFQLLIFEMVFFFLFRPESVLMLVLTSSMVFVTATPSVIL